MELRRDPKTGRRTRPVGAGALLLGCVALPSLAGLAAPAGKPVAQAFQPVRMQPAGLRNGRTPAPAAQAGRPAPLAGTVQFNRDIRPILSDNCFACHGPDKNKRMAGLRLDVREDALARSAIVPGKPEKSTLVARIFAAQSGRLMPPVSSHKRLTSAQKDLLKRWIAQGASYEGHWAYLPLRMPAVPQLRDTRYPVQNPVDAFVRSKLAREGILPAPEADPRTLIRRLHFDLLGVPPAPEDVAAFVSEYAAWERSNGVDDEPRTTDHRSRVPAGTGLNGAARKVGAVGVSTRSWGARGAGPVGRPSSGGNPSPSRGTAHPYDALVERLLNDPRYGERMAIGWLDVVRFADTIGYHSDVPRNVWPYRDYVIRSFNENKPFDRFTLEQVAGDLLPDASQETRVGSAFNRLLLTTEEGGAQPKDYEARMLTDRVRAVGAAWLGQTTGCAQCHDHKFDPISQKDFYALGAFFADIPETPVGRREDGMLVVSPEQEKRLAKLDADLARARQLPAGLDDALAKWESETAAGDFALPELAADSKASQNEKTQARQVVAALKKEAGSRNARERDAIRDYFRTRVEHPFKAELAALAAAEKARREYYDALPKCLVSTSTPRRTVRILPRGNWMDESGEVVKPALLHYLPQPKIEGRELTRLDLAQWLISKENPLTARTVMNRLWKQFFGTGLSRVLDDLGAQGEPPVYPELLDYLASRFAGVTSGQWSVVSGQPGDRELKPWNVKAMVRLIVTSATYRQASTASPRLLALDPDNRKLARQSAFRLDAELVRDNALAVSGLLVPKIGGPSVKPYQPDGYWENLNFPVRTYVPDPGESQYRRGLYTWWQRSFLHPSLLAFDAPTREECAADRTRSNIPQQALVLLNDPTYVEAGRAFASRILTECKGSTEERLAWAWGRALQRKPAASETKVARALLDQHLAVYRADTKAADELLKTGFAPVPAGLDRAELAAWTHVARVLLNLHETITRP